MAQLTWRNVEAPNIDTRGFTQAGAMITNAFDRLGDSITDFQLRKQQGQIDQQVAGLMAIQDPEALQAAMAQVTGPNARQVLEAGNKLYNERLNQNLTKTQLSTEQEGLLNKQALAQHGTTIEGLYTAALSGNREAEAQLRAGSATDPLFSRALSQVADKLASFRDEFTDNTLQADQFGEVKRSNRAQEADAARARAIQAQGLALQRAEIAERRAERESLATANRFGLDSANQFAGLTPEDARNSLIKSPEFRNMSPAQQNAAIQGLGVAHPSFSTPTETQRQGKPGATLNFNRLSSTIAAEARGVESERRAAEAAFWQERPGYDVLRRSQDKQYAGTTFDQVHDRMNTLVNPINRVDESEVRKLLTENNISPGELMAGIDRAGGGGILSRWLNPLDQGLGPVQRIAQQVKEAKATGGIAEITAQASTALSAYDRYLQGLEGIQRRAAGYASTRDGELDTGFADQLIQEQQRFRTRDGRKK